MKYLKNYCHSEGEARRIPCVQKPTSPNEIVILNEAQRSEEPPYTNTGVCTGRFFAVLRMTVVLLCIGAMLLISLLGAGAAFAQKTKAQIKNVNFELVNDNLIITYDIIKYKPGEKFKVWIDVYTAMENKIETKSLTGDVNDSVAGGNRKKIVWDIKKDDIQLDNDIYIVVSASPQIDVIAASSLKSAGTTSMGKWLLLSSAYPGWGDYKMQSKKGYWLIGAAAYGLVASSVIFNRIAASNYDKYLVSTDMNERNNLFNNADTQKQLSAIFITAAVTVWVADLTWLVIKGKKKDVSLGYKYNPAIGKSLLSARVTF
ncbi:hypothetical protein JYU16_02270 [bacterium AH-315-M05]|nr:hypothetical protein [bacterium AH-315-M05]